MIGNVDAKLLKKLGQSVTVRINHYIIYFILAKAADCARCINSQIWREMLDHKRKLKINLFSLLYLCGRYMWVLFIIMRLQQ